MVRLDGVDDDGVLLVLSGKLDAQLDVAAFHLVVDGFAEVVEQALSLIHIYILFSAHLPVDKKALIRQGENSFST